MSLARVRQCVRCERYAAPGSPFCETCGNARCQEREEPLAFGLFAQAVTPASPPEASPLPYVRGDDTSRRAAQKAEPSARSQRGMVLRTIREHRRQGVTRKELELALDGTLNLNAVRPRVLELIRDTWVMELDEERDGSRVLVFIDHAPWCRAGAHGRITVGVIPACHRCRVKLEETDGRHEAAGGGNV